MRGFSVIHRNFGHWDILSNGERLFRIRGGPGKYYVWDERHKDIRKKTVDLKTIPACMPYICDELMYELIVVEGQTPQTIESWNI